MRQAWWTWAAAAILAERNGVRATLRHHNAREVRKTYTFSKDWRVHESMTYFTL